MAKTKKPSDSFVQTTELVLPNDTNTLGNMMGGRMMHLMDIMAAMAAQKFSNRVVVTASADNINFRKQIKLGMAVTITAKVTRSFNSSMEVHVTAVAEDLLNQVIEKSNDAYFTFVAVDQVGRPIDVPTCEPETEEEQKHFAGALRRRQLRLILAGRLKPEDASELRSIFDIKKEE
jgi:acyl-CoA hydrolase